MSWYDDLWCEVWRADDKAAAKKEALASGLSEEEAEKAAEAVAEEKFRDNIVWHSLHRESMK